MPTVQDLAREAAGCYEPAVREDGSVYSRLRDDNEESTGAPDWVRDIVYAAHADCLPDDWKYACIQGALEAIAESDDPEEDGHDFAENYVDVYTGQLLKWLSSGCGRLDYCDLAEEEYGPSDPLCGMANRIMRGQYFEASEVYSLVLAELERLAGGDDGNE